MADACIHILENTDFDDLKPSGTDEIRNTHINIGTGNDLTIEELAKLIKKIISYEGQIIWDQSKPDGTYQKLLDVSKLQKLGWKEKIDLENGISSVYKEYIKYT